MNISFVQFERGFDAFADYLWETKNQGKLWKVCFEADSQIWLFFNFVVGSCLICRISATNMRTRRRKKSENKCSAFS